MSLECVVVWWSLQATLKLKSANLGNWPSRSKPKFGVMLYYESFVAMVVIYCCFIHQIGVVLFPLN